MKIYTKRGDQGMTDLFGGERVFKTHMRVKAYGEVDAANSALGLAFSASDMSQELRAKLLKIMKLLFCAGAEIATASKDKAQHLLDRDLKNRINASHVEALEHDIDAMESRLEPLQSFILPCGSDASARLHMARSAVRRAEVALLELHAIEPLREDILIFFNRLSDFLFVMARLANKEAQVEDIGWSGKASD